MFKLIIVALLLVTGCAASTDNATPIPDPDCGPGDTEAKMLLTPETVTAVSSALESEFGVSGCIEVANPGEYGDMGHLWCCRKAVAQ